ncbi:hypothetical protein C0081_18175 [Cohaesibacter celericrescens]|uniref:Uncharacterized protein n=1 Tax=Cohaesibacter celericrescens TaxID=2067669 RepID=A0A2N5XM19_9HYPH|nr:hypothetical protein C0081_18175 [Cohaesibacter celericrescens]
MHGIISVFGQGWLPLAHVYVVVDNMRFIAKGWFLLRRCILLRNDQIRIIFLYTEIYGRRILVIEKHVAGENTGNFHRNRAPSFLANPKEPREGPCHADAIHPICKGSTPHGFGSKVG